MKKMSNILIGAGLAVLVVAAVQPAMAACPGGILGNGPTLSIPGSDQSSYAPTANPRLSSAATAVFWALGAGNPTLGAGADSGAFEFIKFGPFSNNYADTYNYGLGYPSWAGADWANGNVDGCYTDGGANGTHCTCILVTEERGGVGYFGLFGDQSDASGNYDFGGGAVDLAAIPRARINNSGRQASPNDNLMDLQLSLGSFGAGTFVDPNCANTCGLQWRVRQQVVAGGAAAPSSRDVSGWDVVSADLGTGDGTTVTVDCNTTPGGTGDIYVTAQLVLDSGFESNIVSENTTKVTCDPTLADPKPIEIRRPDARPSRPLNRPRTGR